MAEPGRRAALSMLFHLRSKWSQSDEVSMEAMLKTACYMFALICCGYT
jgi:hypothetical protein